MVDLAGLPKQPQATDRSRLLQALRDGRIRRRAEVIPHLGRDGLLPVSLGQRRLWFLDQIIPERSAYVIADGAWLRGPVDLSVLERSLQSLVDRHETLRTIFETVAGQPMQRVLPANQARRLLEVCDASAREAEHTVAEWVRRPFDLTTGPMLRAIAVRTGQDEVLFGLAVHHIAVDGWSFGILLNELAAGYANLTAGAEPGLPVPHLGYVDFAAWQRESVKDEQHEYWIQTLAGAPESIELPGDRPRPAMQSFRGEVVEIAVPAEVVAGLKSVSAGRNATLFMVLLATFSVVLRRWTGQDDIVVGTSVAGRGRVELESLVGFFVNTVVLRTSLDGDPVWSDVLERVRSTVVAAFEHQDVPFETLVERLVPQRQLSHNPLFQIMFVLQNMPPARLRIPGVAVERVDVLTRTSKFDLSMNWTEQQSGDLVGTMEYDSALFDRTTMERLGTHYVRMLSAVVDHQDSPISQLPMLTAAEHVQIMRRATGATVRRPDRCLPELIADQAQRTPSAVAVRFDGSSVTYAELDRRANQLALRLRELGVGIDDRVGIVMYRGLELMISLLAVLKAGAAYVPVDPDHPIERKRSMISCAGARVALTTAAARTAVPAGDHIVLTVDSTVADPMPGPVPVVAAALDSLAYVIFTSGSTGEPKGVMVSHRSLINRLLWMRWAFEVSAADRVLHKTPYGFDVSVWELFLPLISGGVVVVAPPGAHRDPAALARLMADEHVSLVHFVPPMLAVFIDQSELPALPALRTVVCSGEGLPATLPVRVWERLSVPCHNLYGPTETAIDVTWRPPSANQPDCPVTPLGSPIDNVRVLVLDQGMTPQPVGVAGELFIGGVAVGRGYVGAPGLTAERFVPDPFGPPGSVLYRTGDRARLLSDGDIEFLGRLDRQVKVRGFRVELEEIESVLRAHPSVADAAVVTSAEDRALLGYVAPTAQSHMDPAPEIAIGRWADVFDAAYMDFSSDAEDADYSGWLDSYTRAEFSKAAMDEWVGETVRTIRELAPRDLLEIGCGTGLLLEPLLPSLLRYVGTDIARTAVDRLRLRHRERDHVEIRCAPAHHTEDKGFDTVVLNSVVQYFPDAAYLTDVLDRAVRACGQDGTVFVGDVRSLPLYPAFRLSMLATEQARPIHAGDLLDRLAADLAQERELLVDPAFFVNFAQRHGMVADIRCKTGLLPTEMNIFRYDVILRPQTDGTMCPSTMDRQPWASGRLDLILDEVTVGQQPLVLTGVPHPWSHRLITVLDGARAGGPAAQVDLATVRGEPGDVGIVPGELVNRARQRGLWCYCVPTPGTPGAYDAVIMPQPAGGISGYPLGPADDGLVSEPSAAGRLRELVIELRDLLRDRLPDYMVPERLIALAELPLTANGKVDRTRLRIRLPEVEQGFEPPRGDLEQRLARIVSDLLGLAEVGRDTNFFTIGGESIVALQLVNRARAQGVALTAQAVFQNPTVAAMAAVCTIMSNSNEIETAVVEPDEGVEQDFWQRWDPRPWRPSPRAEPAYPLSPMQHEMLSAALERHEPGLHTAVLDLRVSGQCFDQRAFVAAWELLMKRHAMFRTSFTWRGLPRPVQTPVLVEDVPITLTDVTDLPLTEREARVRSTIARERLHVFDMDSTPHWHITVLRTGGDEFRVIHRMTYLFQDGWSFENVFRELYLAYDSYRRGHGAPDLPAIPAFREYAEWVARRDQTADAAYWMRTMRRFTGRNPIVESIGRAQRLGLGELPYLQEIMTFDPDSSARLRRAAASQGCTLFTLLQTAWALVISVVTGSDSVSFGVVSSGRPAHLPRMADMVGPFNNMLPIVLDIPEQANVSSWLRSVQAEQAEMREHQYAALAQVREWAGLHWREQLYDSYLVFENFPTDPENTRRQQEWQPQLGVTQTEHPLRVLIWPFAELYVEISYYRRYFAVDTIRALLTLFRDVAIAVADNPDLPVRSILKRLCSSHKWVTGTARALSVSSPYCEC